MLLVGGSTTEALPWQSIAPESFDRTFSTKSDIWMYGECFRIESTALKTDSLPKGIHVLQTSYSISFSYFAVSWLSSSDSLVWPCFQNSLRKTKCSSSCGLKNRHVLKTDFRAFEHKRVLGYVPPNQDNCASMTTDAGRNGKHYRYCFASLFHTLLNAAVCFCISQLCMASKEVLLML